MKIPVIYWSGTGNTEAMANAVAEGINENGNEADVKAVADASSDDVKAAEAIALGSPATGSDVIDEEEMDPFVESIKDLVKDKKVVLFGSFDWGEGQFMEDWKERMNSYGANVIKTLIINLEPDEDGLTECKELGKLL